jgi:hypothetical protein
LNWIRPSFQTYPKKCYLSNCLSSLIQNSHSPRCTFNPSSSVAPSLSRSFYNPWTRTINMYPGPALGGSNTTAFHNNRLSSPRPAQPSLHATLLHPSRLHHRCTSPSSDDTPEAALTYGVGRRLILLYLHPSLLATGQIS